VLAGVVAVFASPSPHAQTLTQALAETYNTNPQLLAQRALLRATDEQVPQALSFWRPTVNFTGQIGMATASLEDQPSPAAVAPLLERTSPITRPDLILQLNQPYPTR
jgi:outer membrane protein